MGFYTRITEIFPEGTTHATGLLIHLAILLGSVLLSAYGLRGLLKYAKDISPNWHLMAISFALLTAMPIIDLLSHFSQFFVTDTESIHHMYIFLTADAFVFLYLFVMNFDKEKQDSKAYWLLAASLLIGIVLSYELVELEKFYSVIAGTVYTGAFIGIVGLFYLLYHIVKKLSEKEKTLSLKRLTLDIVPVIAVFLFILIAISMLAEIFTTVLPDFIPHKVVLIAAASLNLFHVMLAMALFGFALRAKDIYNLQAPIRTFIQSKSGKKNGKNGQ